MPYKNIEDRRAARMRSYYNNSENEIKKQKEYVNTKYKFTKEYYKTHSISNWKQSGLIETEQYTYDELFEAYYYQGYCESCGKEFKTTRDKCMDHSHKTGIFRDVVCSKCNALRRYEDANSH